jgi:putative copper export protein
MWFYGGSFSQRVMIDFYAFFTLMLAIAVQEIKNSRLKILFISTIVLLVLVCQIQTYQYRRMQIHWSDMNKEKYWEVFMRIDKL